ncbi:GntR family transcriptional regulator [Kitasatospora sp. NPDC090091]|uniref:GntR family transcriptional regulator n=1 Tax=Kitasatospora sp. NPDC090091 TaxID=3364081 RepID=UPI00382B05D5
MPIERSSSPRYVEIAADLRRRIVDLKEWAPGERIASHKELCQHYTASDSVIHAARRLLLGEGLIESHPGAGSYVRRNRPLRRISRIDRTADAGPEMVLLRDQEQNAGRIGNWAVRSQPVVSNQVIASLLRIESGERVVESVYQYRAGGALVRLTTCWEPYTVVGDTAVMLPESGPLAGRGVVERMAELGVVIGTVQDEVTARAASPEEGELLGGGTGVPVLEVTRTYSDDSSRPVHVERSIVRGDRATLLYRT